MKLLAITPKDVKKKNPSLVYSGTVNRVFFFLFYFSLFTSSQLLRM